MKLVLSRRNELMNKTEFPFVIPKQELSNKERLLIKENLSKQQPKMIEQSSAEIESREGNIHYIFEIPSEWSTAKRELLMLSILTDSQENPKMYEEDIEEFVKKMQTEPDLYKSFYLKSKPNNPEIIGIYGEVRIFLSELHYALSLEKKEHSISKVVFLGQEGVGKSTIIYHLVHGEFNGTQAPTVIPEVLEILYEDIQMQAIDVSGSGKHQDLAEKACKNPDGIVFVIPCTPLKEKHANSIRIFKDLMEKYCAEIDATQSTKSKTTVPLLILCNEFNKPVEVPQETIKEWYHPSEFAEIFKIGKISAKMGTGFSNNFKWLAKKMKMTE